MLKLHTRVSSHALPDKRILKALTLDEFVVSECNPEDCALWVDGATASLLPQLSAVPFAAVFFPTEMPAQPSRPYIAGIADPEVVKPGDVISIGGDSLALRVLYRRGANSNILFITERCNSYCLMCSQPPRDIDDSWRHQENLTLLRLIDKGEAELGITGGEPTLIKQDLVELIDATQHQLPNTALHILTNGRQFANPFWCDALPTIKHPNLMWAVPLYSDYAADHDHIVQAPGAFSETMKGLYQLAASKQKVEIRVVLHALSVPRLTSLCEFIFRNLPFVSHVALMGIEPMGFARANREALWIDPVDYGNELAEAVWFLENRGITVSIYNLPFCVLPKSLWCFARQSISDWKHAYIDECQRCSLQSRCAGFFAWDDTHWRSRGVRAVGEEEGTLSHATL